MRKFRSPVKESTDSTKALDVFHRGSFHFPQFGGVDQHGDYESNYVMANVQHKTKVSSSGRYGIVTIQGVPLRWRSPSPYRYELFKAQDGNGRMDFHSIDYRGPWRLYDYFGGRVCWPGPYYVNSMRSTPMTDEPKGKFIKSVRHIPFRNPIITYYGTMSTNQLNEFNVALLNKIGDRAGSFGIAAAEFMKSVNTVASGFTSIVRAAAAVRRGDMSRAVKALNSYSGARPNTGGKPWHADITKSHVGTTNVANRWLELKYGWTPIVNDVNAALGLLSRGIETTLTGHTRLGRSFQESGRNVVASKTGDTVTHVTGSYGVSSTIYWGVSSHTVRTMAKLGLSDLAGIAYDLIPYSFLTDWVVPISKVISAVDATRGLHFISGTQTHFRELRAESTTFTEVRFATCKFNVLFPRGQDVSIVTKSNKSKTYACKTIDRVVLPTFPAAIPYFTNPLSSHHLMTALSLMKSRDFERNYVRRR